MTWIVIVPIWEIVTQNNGKKVSLVFSDEFLPVQLIC